MLNPLVKFMEIRGCFRMIKRLNRETREPENYLYRGYIFRCHWFGIYLHQFWSSDPDHYHDHPWWSLSWILKGGYHEYNADGSCSWRRSGMIKTRPAEVFHRIEIGPHSAGSTWSLFIHLNRKRAWGFMTPEGWLEAEEYGRKYDSTVMQEGAGYKIKGHLFPVVVPD